jgi:hypothetical protein
MTLLWVLAEQRVHTAQKTLGFSHIAGTVLIWIFYRRCSMLKFYYFGFPVPYFQNRRNHNFLMAAFPRVIFLYLPFFSMTYYCGETGWDGQMDTLALHIYIYIYI